MLHSRTISHSFLPFRAARAQPLVTIRSLVVSAGQVCKADSPMEPSSTGEYIALVVQLQAAADGTWRLLVDGADGMQIFPLLPLTLVIRLWRSSDRRLLRGVLRLGGNDRWAPFQSNAQLEELVRAWLLGGAAHADD